MSNHNLGIALKWAAAGAAVFPVEITISEAKIDKVPRVKWRAQSTTDPETIKGWWKEWPDSAPGIDLAKVGLVVLDGDRHGGPDGVAGLDQLFKDHGLNASAIPMVITPQNGGRHAWFKQPVDGEPLGNRDKAVKDLGINIRGAGGFIVAPGVLLPDGRRYQRCDGTPSTIEGLIHGTIPVLPPTLAALLRAKPNGHDEGAPQQQTKMNGQSFSGVREESYAEAALAALAAELAATASGGRNNKLNDCSLRMGHLVGAGWIARHLVEQRLLEAAQACGLADDDGFYPVKATIKSGLDAGEKEPTAPLQDREDWRASSTNGKPHTAGPKDQTAAEFGISLDDFYAYMPQHSYIYIPSRDMWPASSVNARLAPVPIVGADGKPALDDKGNPKTIAANKWLDQNRPVSQMTWAPGEPLLIANRMIADGGWFDRQGDHCLNIYRPPVIKHATAAQAAPWLDHVNTIYPSDAGHLVKWLAHRVQRPGQKINHAVVLGGNQGIGKDTLLEPVKHAVGPWNFIEVSPAHMLGRFNGYLKSVILRINEAHDLGDVNRFQFYDHLKAYTAAPPDVLRVDEKNLREYSVINCCGVIITSNHKSDGIFLPADDRRHYVAWSNFNKEDFDADYWNKLWGWYSRSGFQHVAAYLAELDISNFDPKAPPPKTSAFWDIVNASRSPEDAELADVLDGIGNPDATTLVRIQSEARGDFEIWITDRKNRRVIPHRLEACGYTPVRNNDAKSGL
jgi:hypothetical protein